MSKAAVGDDALQGRRSPVAGNLGRRHRHARAPTSARRAATRSTSRASRSSASRTTTRSRRRSTASTTCSTAGTCGSAASGSRRSCASATRSSTPSATSSTAAASSSPTRRSSRRPPARDDDAVSGAVFRGPDRLPDAERSALQRSQRDGARPRLLLRPDVPRREVEDAPPPHRVLDGRARGGLRRPERRHGARRRPRRLGRRRASSTSAAPELDGHRARRLEARSRSRSRSRASRTTMR